MKRSTLLSILLFATAIGAWAQRFYLHSDNPLVHWEVEPAEPVEGVRAVTAVVPGTVFNSYVVAGREKDPNFGDNIEHVDRKRYDRSFWYRTSFRVPTDFTLPHVWLNMDGVNRTGEVWLNGKRLGCLDGFMERGRYDISEVVKRDADNTLEILVGIPEMPLANQGSPNYLSSGGWDWMPYVPGLNSGITDRIWLSNTGHCVLQDPWVRSNLPTRGKAEVDVRATVHNLTGQDQLTRVKGVIQPGNIEFETEAWVWKGQSREFRFSSQQFEQLIIHNPRLWWPNGYGEPNLYTCTLSVIQDGRVSDTRHITFGIRRYTYDTEGGIFHIRCNDVPIFVKGANWGMSEYMLRCRGSEYETKIRLHHDMHFNMIRNWLGSVTDEEFYDQCDRYGIMVWDDFWINSTGGLPNDLNAFNKNVMEKILRLRNHPCIAVWCGDNEGTPEPPLTGWMRENIQTFDGGERWFQPRSNADALSGSGYWGAYDERYYFLPYPCQKSDPTMTLGWGFRTEIGTAVVPTFESLLKFMPEDHLWPIDDMWNMHYFGSKAGNAQPDKYRHMVDAYGQATGAEDFCRKAQLVNLQSNKAMYEGWVDHIWDDASGLMNWMGQSAYPSMVWQTYDYYYDMTGAYWGCKYGSEPLHVMWNPVTDEVRVANTTRQDHEGLTVEASVYNSDGSLVRDFTRTARLDAASNTTTTALTLPFTKTRRCLSLGCHAVASSTSNGRPEMVCDGKDDTRWSADKADNEWIYLDLGSEQEVGQIRLNFEAAYGRAYRLQVSDDARHWREVVKEDNGHEGVQVYTFPEVKARYVRMLGIELGFWYGYSLWDFSAWGPVEATDGLSDVHFIRLVLRDKDGRIVSQNSYWRGQNRTDYSSISRMKEPPLKIKHNLSRKDGRATITAALTLPSNAGTVAVATHVTARSKVTGERLLPAIQNDDYLNIFPGETRTVTIQFADSLLQGGGYTLEVEPFNAQHDDTKPVRTKSPAWGDQGDGTFVNPVLCADYSDPDVIRVGDKYYMTCSEFHYMGMPMLESDDMVNWRIIGQIYNRIDLPIFERMEGYGDGTWAPALRYHDGRFYVFVCMPHTGLYMTSAQHPEGPWEPLHLVQAANGWEDPCPLWDDQGNAWLGRSQLGAGPIYIHRMSPDGRRLLDEGVKVYEGPVAEGTKLFIRDGYYYLSIPEGGVGTGWQTVLRSKSIYGPYEGRRVLEQGVTDVNGPHQGALVDTPDGEWWFYHFQSMDPQGRVLHLQPVRWMPDGFPMIGQDVDGNGVGEPMKVVPMPRTGKRQKPMLPQTSDNFDNGQLGIQWQTNHNATPDGISVHRRKGWLSIQALPAEKLEKARNQLAQKTMGYRSEATVRLSTTDMTSGQRAGMALLGGIINGAGVMVTDDGQMHIYFDEHGHAKPLPQPILPPHSDVWIRLTINAARQQHQFSYSLDGKHFIPIGITFREWSHGWKGTHISLYTYTADHSANGTQAPPTAHFDDFMYEVEH